MSELSEEAFHAGWMEDLELSLWQVKNGEISKYGRLEITESIIEKLQIMSKEIDGWVYFDSKTEETYISIEDWEKKIRSYR